jgi:hypothetical protein
MAESQAFTIACEQLEQATNLERIEARGTIRLALKEAGLDAASVSGSQLTVVVEKILPRELEARGVADTASVCSTIKSALASAPDTDGPGNSPEDVFSRLAG